MSGYTVRVRLCDAPVAAATKALQNLAICAKRSALLVREMAAHLARRGNRRPGQRGERARMRRYKRKLKASERRARSKRWRAEQKRRAGTGRASHESGAAMKIQTNEGEVELTAEMVCKGMVFRDRKGETLTVGARVTENIWADVHDARSHGVLLRWPEFLGCDPAIASRADCERYGVHGDAAAHGFARLRGGGTVDMRRVALPTGAVYESQESGDRIMVSGVYCAPMRVGESFVGIDLNHASPEDVERLCCGDHQTEEILPPIQHRWSATSRVAPSPISTKRSRSSTRSADPPQPCLKAPPLCPRSSTRSRSGSSLNGSPDMHLPLAIAALGSPP